MLQVGEIVMEVLHDSCDGFYAEQPKCSTVLATMLSMGFAPSKNCTDGEAFYTTGCEANVRFRNMRSNVTGHLPHVSSDHALTRARAG